MNILCWLGKHDYKVYHRGFRNKDYREDWQNISDKPMPKTILKPVHKCKRCGKKVYEY